MLEQNLRTIQGDAVQGDKAGGDKIGGHKIVAEVINITLGGLALSGATNKPPNIGRPKITPASYLYLKLSTQDGNPVDKVDPEQTYTLEVISTTNSEHPTTGFPLDCESDSTLYLTCTEQWIEPDSASQIPLSAESDYTKLELKVDPLYKGREVTFTLYQHKPDRPDEGSIALFKLKGKTAEERALDLNINLTARPDREEVRILHIQSTHADRAARLISHWNQKNEFEIEIPKPARNLRKLMRKRDYSGVMEEIRDWSALPIFAPFATWFKAHLSQHGHNFAIIFCDSSEDWDMVWEMLHVDIRGDEDLADCEHITSLPSHLKEEVPIGALINITRWIPDLKSYDHQHMLQVAETLAEGQVLSFVDNQSQSSTPTEQQFFTQFTPHCHDDFTAFKTVFKGTLSQYGLIYLASHGKALIDKRDQKEFRSATAQKKQAINAYNLTAHIQLLHEIETRPIVMINAYDSAWRLRRGDRYYGIAEQMLRLCAKEFIGTIGPVGPQRAAQIAQALFSACHQEACIATAFRMLRAEMVAHYKEKLNQETELSDDFVKDYIDTFLYVHYGSPYTKLRLTPATPPPTGDETG